MVAHHRHVPNPGGQAVHDARILGRRDPRALATEEYSKLVEVQEEMVAVLARL